MKPPPDVKQLSAAEVEALLARLASGSQTPDDVALIRQVFGVLAYITELVARKDRQLKTLLKRLFGFHSERAQKVRQQLKAKSGSEPDDSPSDSKPDLKKKKKPKGHGRNGVDDYSGAEQQFIDHSDLSPKDACPECGQGKVYEQAQPGVFISFTGMPAINATVFKAQKLRCNLCGEVFTAELPESIRDQAAEVKGGRYFDASAKSMMAILRYGFGMPLNRLSRLQESLGIPLAASTLWDKIKESAAGFICVLYTLRQLAAQGDLIHHDDTGIKVLSLMEQIALEKEQLAATGNNNAQGKNRIRTGLYTTGIVVKYQSHQIVLFFSGRRHAGENLSDLLAERDPNRGPPITMSDAKSGNVPDDVDAVISYCNAHARRKFVDIADDFPDECLYVIVTVFGKIYQHDAIARKRNYSDAERLAYHQENSGPIMQAFADWMEDQIDQKKVEPNSSLGKAIRYVQQHWEPLTRFLHVPGVPLDNNLCERSLKMAIVHRRNSLFYKTPEGARVGDLFMSLIHTCRLAGTNPFHYLTQLQIHSAEVRQDPHRWLPWNYKETLSSPQRHCA
jgi:transposase